MADLPSPENKFTHWLWYLVALPPIIALLWKRIVKGFLVVHGWWFSERDKDRALLRELADKMGALADAMKEQTESNGRTMKHVLANIEILKQQSKIQSGRSLLHMDINPIPRFECRMPDGACSYANPAIARLFGLDPHGMLNWGWMTRVHAEDVDRVRTTWLNTVEHFMSYRIRYRLVSGIEVEATGEMFRDDKGQPVLFSGTVIPVDELPA